MFHKASPGLTSLRGLPRLWMSTDEGFGGLPPRLMVFDMNEKFNDTLWNNTPTPISRLYGSVTALTIALIGITVSLMASFLTSTETSLLSWKSNSGIPLAPGSKFGLYMSLWLREFLDRIGIMQPVKSPPTTIPQSSFPNRYTTLPAYRHYNQRNSVSTSFERGN